MLLTFAVIMWAGGFDMIYGCADYDFDREHGTNSFAKRFGIGAAIRTTRVMHLLAAGAPADAGHLDEPGPVLLHRLGDSHRAAGAGEQPGSRPMTCQSCAPRCSSTTASYRCRCWYSPSWPSRYDIRAGHRRRHRGQRGRHGPQHGRRAAAPRPADGGGVLQRRPAGLAGGAGPNAQRDAGGVAGTSVIRPLRHQRPEERPSPAAPTRQRAWPWCQPA